MSGLGLNSKDRKSTRDKANISNPKVNRGCAPLTANCISADCVQISLGPSIPCNILGVYYTGGFNAMQHQFRRLFTNISHQEIVVILLEVAVNLFTRTWFQIRSFTSTRQACRKIVAPSLNRSQRQLASEGLCGVEKTINLLWTCL